MNRQSILLFSLVSVAAAISWWLSSITAPEQTSQQGAEQYPNAYASKLSVISYNKQGDPQHKLMAPTMRHYEKNDTTELDLPIMWQFNGDKPAWMMRGEMAIMTSDKDTLFMSGQVNIDREGDGVIRPYHIVTHDLTVKTVIAYAETEKPIRFDSNDHQINAIGMQGWLQDPVRIKLRNSVRGRYEIQ